jgi:hypothetical protein
MNQFTRIAVAALSATAFQTAQAQGPATEVGAATVWYALLVVVFALLISVGLYVARDQDESAPLDPEPKPQAPKRDRRHRAHPRRKQQEFS